MSSALTLLPPSPSPSKLKYATVLDAGSSATRVYVYSWDASQGDENLKVTKVYPDEEALAKEKNGSVVLERTPGFAKMTPEKTESYLILLLEGAHSFLRVINSSSQESSVPVYLLATGGMRLLSETSQLPLLQKAHQVLSDAQKFPLFDAGTREENVRVISGRTEGVLGWVALNYGDERKQGLFEVGGASVQIAYGAGRHLTGTGGGNAKVCIAKGGAADEVYSETWDGFGADSVYAELRNIIWNEARAAGDSVGNPCLPRGAPDAHIKGIIGTGDFRTCLSLAKRILTQGAKKSPPMPYYPFVQETSNLFIGVANLQYTYEFFAAKPGAGYLVSEPYNRRLFTAAVERYCTGFFDGEVTKFSHAWCFKAAWMLTVLHDDESGFGMDKVQVLKGMLKFPNGREMEERASWTMGAAVLIARNGGLKGCRGAVEPLSVGEGRGETFGVVAKRIFELGAMDLGVGGLAPFASVANALDSARARASGNVTAGVVNVAGFAAVLFVLWIFVRRRFRGSRATARKVGLLGSGLKL